MSKTGKRAATPIYGQDPYAQLAHILHDLYWLASEVRRKQTDVFAQINSTTDSWDAAEQLARSTSPLRGIPLVVFDPALNQARQIRDELVQVAAGNENVAFHALDYRYTENERRLKELGTTWVGSGTGAPCDQGRTEQGEEDAESGNEQLKPSREKAYRLFQWAMEQKPDLKTDRDVYDWLNEHPDVPEELPSFAAWSKYLREARAYYKDHKHTPRTLKRATGKSVVRRDQL